MTAQYDPGAPAPEGYDRDEWRRALAEGRLDEFWADLDVRRVVAQLPRGDGGPRLDDVAWHRFTHAYASPPAP